MTEQNKNVYKGKIVSVKDRGYIPQNRYMSEIGFVVGEGEHDGASIFVRYIFSSSETNASFIENLETKLGEDILEKTEVPAEVSLTGPINDSDLEYIAKGPLRFLKKEKKQE